MLGGRPQSRRRRWLLGVLAGAAPATNAQESDAAGAAGSNGAPGATGVVFGAAFAAEATCPAGRAIGTGATVEADGVGEDVGDGAAAAPAATAATGGSAGAAAASAAGPTSATIAAKPALTEIVARAGTTAAAIACGAAVRYGSLSIDCRSLALVAAPRGDSRGCQAPLVNPNGRQQVDVPAFR